MLRSALILGCVLCGPVLADEPGKPLPPGALARLGTPRPIPSSTPDPLFGLPVSKPSPSPPSLHFLPNGELLTFEAGVRLRRWAPRRGKLLQERDLAGLRKLDLAHSIVSLRDDWLVVREGEHLAVRDLHTTALRCRLENVELGQIARFYLAVAGQQLLLAQRDEDGQLLLRWFDPATGKQQRRLSVELKDGWSRHPQRSLKLSRDDRILTCITDDDRLVLIDLAKGAVKHLHGDDRASQGEAGREAYVPTESRGFSRDGRYLIDSTHARSSVSSEFYFWDLQGGFCQRAVRLSRELAPKACLERWALSPDNRLLAVVLDPDHTILVLETISGQPLTQWKGDGHPVSEVAFSPDGQSLAAVGADATVLIWDMDRPLAGTVLPAKQRSAEELEELWRDLGDRQPHKSEPALWALLGGPGQALPLLKANLKAVPLATVERVRARITDLDSPSFRKRELAVKELTELAELALPEIRATLERQNLGLEVKQRLEGLLRKLDDPATPPAGLRELRAIAVLERIGTPEAREVLQTLASGAPQARVTQDAQAALARK